MGGWNILNTYVIIQNYRISKALVSIVLILKLFDNTILSSLKKISYTY